MPTNIKTYSDWEKMQKIELETEKIKVPSKKNDKTTVITIGKGYGRGEHLPELI